MNQRLNPLIAGAAVAVILVSIVGVGAMTGMLPGTSAKAPDPQTASSGATTAVQKSPSVQKVSAAPAARAKPKCLDCGVVLGVKEIEVKGEGTGLGAVAGGVAGAVVGNQVVEGKHRDLATVAGAVGGAVAGHHIEKHARTQKRFDVEVRMEDGSLKTVSSETEPAWRNGDRVRVANGKLEPI